MVFFIRKDYLEMIITAGRTRANPRMSDLPQVQGVLRAGRFTEEGRARLGADRDVTANLHQLVARTRAKGGFLAK
jgi:hypothetical protein